MPPGMRRTPRRLGESACDLGHRSTGGNADAGRESLLIFDRRRQLANGAQDRRVIRGVARLAVERFAACEVHVELVDAGDLDDRRVAGGDFSHGLGVLPVGVAAGRQEDGLSRGEAHSLGEGHSGAHAESAYLVATCGDHAALAWPTSHDHRLAFEGGVEESLDRDEEGVEVEATEARCCQSAHVRFEGWP